jgi:hypothetical protein
MKFPQYRSLNNNQVVYQIISDIEFIELKITGKYYSINNYMDHQYPEKVNIREMILNPDKEYLEINKNDFELIKLSCDKTKTRIDF